MKLSLLRLVPCGCKFHIFRPVFFSGFFVKKSGPFLNLSIMYSIIIFLFYILLIWGCVRTPYLRAWLCYVIFVGLWNFVLVLRTVGIRARAISSVVTMLIGAEMSGGTCRLSSTFYWDVQSWSASSWSNVSTRLRAAYWITRPVVWEWYDHRVIQSGLISPAYLCMACRLYLPQNLYR